MNARSLNKETIFVETPHYSIHRIETAEHGTVIVKASRSAQPSRKEISQLENEYRILKSLEDLDGVPRAIALEVESHKALLVLQDFGGISLRDYAQNRPVRLDQFFKIAKRVVAIVGALHAKNIVHCDLKPTNVLINPQTDEIQIIDFGCSRHLVGRGQFQNDGQGMTLAYIAPEQTGRVNRRVDHRTDFYSLGITFYELLAGKLPFHGTDVLEWVHAHVAKQARPLHEVDHHITPAVSQIVERLMNKTPEERYQTPEGLIYDLEKAEQLFNDRKLWDTITLGERDRSTKILLSQKVVGRGKEIEVLNAEYMMSQAEGLRYVAINGEAGVGKSALSREFRRMYADQVALFGFGKADQRQSTFPFSSFSSVAEDLVRQISNAPEHLRGEFVTLLERKLESGLGALLITAPSLKELVCSIEKVDDATDTIGRLYVSIATFFETMADVFGQVVIHLDDAHFIDEASAKAIAWLLENKADLHLLVLTSYRATELQTESALSPLLQAFDRNFAKGQYLELGDLTLDEVALFIQDTLQESNELFKQSSLELADLLLRKSGGNALFMGQVFKSWLDEQLLFHDPYRGWTWDQRAISSKEIAKSVLDLLGTKINSLPKNIRYLFTMASCYPKTFSTTDLSELTGVDDDGIRKAARAVIEAGLVIPESESIFRFAHEQIREAFYSLLNLESRRDLHAHVGLKLLNALSFDSVSNDELYLTAEHLNVGISKVRDAKSRARMAELNLKVSQLARDASAFELGLTFAKAGLAAGDQLTWDDPNETLFKLQILKGECEYLAGDLQSAEQTFGFIRSHAAGRNAKIKAALLHVRLLQSKGRMVETMNEGLGALAEFGVRIPRRPSFLQIGFSSVRAMWDLRGDRTARIPLLTGTTPDDEFKRLRHDLLVVTGAATYYIDKKVMFMTCVTGYRLAMKEGLSGEIANQFLIVGMVLANKLGWYRQIERNCVNTVDRVQSLIPKRAQIFFNFNRNAFVRPWISPWSETTAKFENVVDEAVRAGEPYYASIAGLYLPYYRMYQGHDIEETEETLANRDIVAKRDLMLLDCAWPGYGFRALLRGETASETDFSHEGFNEAEYLERVNALPTPNPRAWYDAHKMMALFMFGQYDQATAHFAGARKFLELVPFSITNVWIRSLGVMVVCENERAGRKSPWALRRRVRQARKQVKMWARNNPLDVEPFYYLVEAEIAAMRNRQLEAMALYEQAAQAALKTKSWMVAGVIYERTARFNVFNKRERLARAHAEEAAYCFERWGASAKVAQVRKVYGLQSTRNPIATDSQSSSSGDARRLGQMLDVQSMMKATRALSSELDINVLSVKLTEVMMESAGASKAVLLMPSGDSLQVKSVAGSDEKSIPEFVTEVARRAETVLVADSSAHDATKNDAYFKKAMSALCIPIVQKSKVQALVYLENESSTNVFNAERLEMLSILLGQAGIALENARLYWEVSEKARMAGELKTAQAVQRTLFPAPQLKLDSVAVTGFYEPATECGGDWWFHHRHGDKLYVYIGDATGHGASAALVTSAARSAVALLSTAAELSPKRAMGYLNRAIFETSKGTMNMTFFIGAFDTRTGAFDYCNASHEPPFFIKNGISGGDFAAFKSTIESLADVHGPRLGESLDSEYRQSTIEMDPNDLVVLFTDGVQDARNDQSQQWGQRRFLKALHQATSSGGDVDSLVQKVIADNKGFTNGTPLDDDIMVVALKRVV